MSVQRHQVSRFPFLITLLVIPVALSCGIIGDEPSTPAPGSISGSPELQQACGDLDQEVDEWIRSEKLRLEEDFVIYGMTMVDVSERVEQMERDAEAMRRELLDECLAEAKEPLPTHRDSTDTESGRGRSLPTPTSTSTPRTAVVVPTPTRVPTSTPAPRLTRAPTSTPETPAPTPETVPDTSPLIAAFAEVPATHNGEGAIQFRLLFTEPVTTSYKVLRDVAIQVENGTVRESKRVDKRSDLWMVPSSRMVQETW